MSRRIASLLIGVVAACAVAAEFTVTWNAPVGSPVPVAGYVVYVFTNAVPAQFTTAPLVRVDAGTNLQARIENLPAGRYAVTATAYATNGIESDFAAPLMVEIASPPQQLRTVILQHNATLTTTNWQEAGFFRVKIQ